MFNYYKNVNCFLGFYKIEELIRLVNINVLIVLLIVKGEDYEKRYSIGLLYYNLFNFFLFVLVIKKVRFLDSVFGLM